MNLHLQKPLLGLAAVVTAVTLAGCGKSASSTTSSAAAPTSAKSSQASSHQVDTMIQKGDYAGALAAVKSDQTSDHNQALASDLQNYLTAKKDYQNKHYDQALTSLNTAASSSTPMKQAYTDLRTKINTARQQQQAGQASSTSASAKSSSQSTTSSQTPINTTATQNTSESVINAFASKEGFNQSGYGISPVAKNGEVYRFEVRKNNTDNTVANLVGIYEYNANTGAVTKIA